MKNILLVMASQGILVPPSENKEQEPLWNETWKRLDRFLPHLFAEIFPEEAKKPRSSIAGTKKDVERAGTPSNAAGAVAASEVDAEAGKEKDEGGEKMG